MPQGALRVVDIIGPNGVITKTASDQLAWQEDADRVARRVETVHGVMRIVEAVLCLAVLFVLVRFVFAYLVKLS